MFFLWPLRLMSLGALGLGVLMAHSALRVKHRKLKNSKADYSRRMIVLHEMTFWAAAIGILGMLIFALYIA
jgi:uncharacterized integral membrane protein